MQDASRPRILGPKASLLAAILLDLAVLTASAACVVALRSAFGGGIVLPRLYLGLSWALGLYFCIAASMGLYPGYLRTPPEELKILSWVTTLFFLVIGSLTFFSRGAELYSRSIFLGAWLLCLLTLPAARILARRFLGHLLCWGYPCVLIGSSEEVHRVLDNLQHDRRHSLWPLAAVTETGAPLGGGRRIPVVPFAELELIAAQHPHCHAILVYATGNPFPPPELAEALSFHFKHVLLSSRAISDLSLWTKGVDVGGSTFLKTYFKLLDPTRRRFKRVFDLVLCVLGSVVALPLLLGISLAIKLDSRGPVLFRQPRLGQGGREFQILKFRTMHCDAQACLERMLAEDPELAREWEVNQKLRADPRITRVGRFLRATSLDELPQFFNVIDGTMSLVGPRPILVDQAGIYGEAYEIYTRLEPGITGLWQVSGRNRLSFERRAELDVYYARNWSIWMDFWILGKTVREILTRSGK
jgi:Undecaprenyl-phosphate galactose phosphotransferase WbaP